MGAPLPEANPLGKQLLQREIAFFLDTLRKRGAKPLLDRERPSSAAAPPQRVALSNPSDVKVYQYVTGESDVGETLSTSSGGSSRPGTVGSQDFSAVDSLSCSRGVRPD